MPDAAARTCVATVAAVAGDRVTLLVDGLDLGDRHASTVYCTILGTADGWAAADAHGPADGYGPAETGGFCKLTLDRRTRTALIWVNINPEH